jgi:toxin FitB
LSELLVPSITITEVFKTVLHLRGEEAALVIIAHMKQGKVIPLDSELAINAAKVGAMHNLSLADSIVFATAQRYAAVLWTEDTDFDGLTNVRYTARRNVY